MKTRDIDRNAPLRDEPPAEGDRYARESFTFRRMKTWQIWASAIGAVVLALIVAVLIQLY